MPISKEVTEAICDLPLEKCSLERNFVTREVGWRAPMGFIFRVKGQFCIYSDSSDPADMVKPLESKSLLVAENHELYDRLLEESGGDEEDAWQNFLDEIEDEHLFPQTKPPTSFVGKWLIIPANCKQNLCVKAELDAWYGRDYLTRLEGCWFESEQGEIKWRQYYAEAVLGKSQISLIEYEEKYPGLYVPEPVDQTNIALPLKGLSSTEYCNARTLSTGEAITEDERWGIIRDFRLIGRPLSDDPLKEMVFPSRTLVVAKDLSAIPKLTAQ